MGISAFESFASEPAPSLTRGMTPDFDESGGRYRVRFAQGADDLEAIYELRFEVFNREMGEGLDASWVSGLDRDEYDEQCQHLMVLDRSAENVVGTYRLQVAEAAEEGNGFYSAEEFLLDQLPQEVLKDSIELGRACIVAKHRNRNVLFLLWRGLASYVLWHRKRFFFGCNSLTTHSPREGLRMHRYLVDHDHLHSKYRVEPRPGYECVETVDDDEADLPLEIPPLFGIYLRYGAKICGPPALDRDFKTVDFFTINDLAEMDERTFQNFAGKR